MWLELPTFTGRCHLNEMKRSFWRLLGDQCSHESRFMNYWMLRKHLLDGISENKLCEVWGDFTVIVRCSVLLRVCFLFWALLFSTVSEEPCSLCVEQMPYHYRDAPSQDALYGTAAEAGEGFWVHTKFLRVPQEVETLWLCGGTRWEHL